MYEKSYITKHDFISLAKAMNIKKAEVTISKISQVVSSWNNYAEEVKVKPSLRDKIYDTLLFLNNN